MELPNDMIIYLALHMDLPEVLSFCKTSSKINNLVCNNEIFWRNRLKKDYNITTIPTNLEIVDKGKIRPVTPKEYYQHVKSKLNMARFNVLLDGASAGDMNLVLLSGTNHSKKDYDMALGRASSGGHLDVVKYLVKMGADIHYNNEAPLIAAATEGRINVVEYLVEHGIDDKDYINWAIREATYYDQPEMVEYLSSLELLGKI